MPHSAQAMCTIPGVVPDTQEAGLYAARRPQVLQTLPRVPRPQGLPSLLSALQGRSDLSPENREPNSQILWGTTKWLWRNGAIYCLD